MNRSDWHIPLARDDLTLRQGPESPVTVGARRRAMPLVDRLPGTGRRRCAYEHRECGDDGMKACLRHNV